MELFQRRDIDQYTDSLAAYLPGGELFASKSVQDSNFRKLLRGLSWELFRANGLLRDYSNEVLPDQTEKFIDEWEATLGIPDQCFTGKGSIANRRVGVLTKLAALGVQTVEDFEQLAATFGVSVTVIPGLDSGIVFNNNKTARFTIVVNILLPARFPYTFPLPFGDDTIAFLECIFSKLKPGNCQVLFQEV